MKRLLSTGPVEKARGFYKRHEKYLPVVFFVSGFLWDSLTLTRIDSVVDNLVLLAYLLLLGALIVLLNMADAGRVGNPLFTRYRQWYPLGIQFFLGGLFSSYVVFYFQSASLSKTSLFLVILALLFVANEFLQNRLANFYLQMALFFMVSYSFLVFFIPVAIKVMNYATFLAAGLASLLVSGGILYLFWRKAVIVERKKYLLAGSLLAGLFLLFNLFYMENWIPPVPLSLKSGGIYHEIQREGDEYVLTYGAPPWYRFWVRSDSPFQYSEGDKAYCFTAIFAPARLEKEVFHHWQRYDEKRKQWRTADRIAFKIIGGRGMGYRGYTYKNHVSTGKWRVEVKTGDGLLLGRIGFDIVNSTGKGGKYRTRRI